MGYSPRGHKESDTTERLHFTSTINIQKRLLVHTVIVLVFFFFKRIAILFSRVAVPFYIPSSYVYNPVFPHSHQFVVHHYFLLSHSDM